MTAEEIKELLKKFDLKAELEKLMREDFLYGEIFPPIFF
jgi:hypothetical protein